MEPAWVIYLGAGVGVVGAITGISALVLAAAANRQVKSMKSQELRIELRKLLNVLHSDFNQLPILMTSADKSRRSLYAAKGLFQSGMMKKWELELQEDRTGLMEIGKRIPKPIDSENISSRDLEIMIGQAHSVQLKVTALKDKYESRIREDAEGQRQLAADRRVPQDSRSSFQ